MLEIVPLELMPTNATGRVVEIHGSQEAIVRLAEIGLRVELAIRMIRPGEPCLIAIGDQRFSLRLNDDTQIFVELDASP